MLARHNRLKKRTILIFLLTAAFLLPALSAPLEARKPIRWRVKKTVVIDPGHGGHESGARGASGLMEKVVTLETARRIESNMKNRFKVHLTRTDDYAVAIIRRTDVANHLQADVFVSIHTGASFQHDARGMRIFFFEENRWVAPAESHTETGHWDRLQIKHVEKSKTLAQSLCKRLQAAVPAMGCEVEAAPLLVLRGADMPAVLIEVGTLTNTEDEKQLNADENLTLLGEAIADGINDFLRQPADSAGQ
jgi:N-acetylmuramoyl-L-alanine amidase